MQARALTAICRRQELTFVETDKPLEWLEGNLVLDSMSE